MLRKCKKAHCKRPDCNATDIRVVMLFASNVDDSSIKATS